MVPATHPGGIGVLVGVGVSVGAGTRVFVGVAVGGIHAPKSTSIVWFPASWTLNDGWVVGE